jgi:cytochrome b pre-mRNA-processing protein 3
MILHLFRRTPQAATIASLYGMIVAQARNPSFYRFYGVPDTIDGRFEMIALHTVLVLRRLGSGAADLRRLGQGLFDAFCEDMDASMREMGVGDLAVPRKMRRIGEAFYGRQAGYRDALAASGDAPLIAMLNRHVFADAAPALGAERLAAYMRAVAEVLAEADGAAFMRAQAPFPDPHCVMPAVGAAPARTEP